MAYWANNPIGRQLVERCTGTAEVKGSTPVQAWNFFRLSFYSCKSCVYNCDDLLSYNSSPRSSHIWFSYIHNFRFIFVKWKKKGFHLPHNLNGLISIYLFISSAEREAKDSGSSGMFQRCIWMSRSCFRMSRSCFGISSKCLRVLWFVLSRERNNYEKVLLLEEIKNK